MKQCYLNASQPLVKATLKGGRASNAAWEQGLTPVPAKKPISLAEEVIFPSGEAIRKQSCAQHELRDQTRVRS
jgi:hypothetical protein